MSMGGEAVEAMTMRLEIGVEIRRLGKEMIVSPTRAANAQGPANLNLSSLSWHLLPFCHFHSGH